MNNLGVESEWGRQAQHHKKGGMRLGVYLVPDRKGPGFTWIGGAA
jgi:hypothetical protein